jgi:hypothetical protein
MIIGYETLSQTGGNITAVGGSGANPGSGGAGGASDPNYSPPMPGSVGGNGGIGGNGVKNAVKLNREIRIGDPFQ